MIGSILHLNIIFTNLLEIRTTSTYFAISCHYFDPNNWLVIDEEFCSKEIKTLWFKQFRPATNSYNGFGQLV
jgi:hypothetical protein